MTDPLVEEYEVSIRPRARKILWIDDQPIRFSTLKPLLKQEKYKDTLVVFAHGPEQIEFYLDNYSWDLVILDHDMPLMDGMQVIEKFLKDRDLPVLLCSANPFGALNQSALLETAGVSHYSCPVFERDFLKYVQDILHYEKEEADAR